LDSFAPGTFFSFNPLNPDLKCKKILPAVDITKVRYYSNA
jgi:hypothetical protein